MATHPCIGIPMGKIEDLCNWKSAKSIVNVRKAYISDPFVHTIIHFVDSKQHLARIVFNLYPAIGYPADIICKFLANFPRATFTGKIISKS